jgi:hypothetical protein
MHPQPCGNGQQHPPLLQKDSVFSLSVILRQCTVLTQRRKFQQGDPQKHAFLHVFHGPQQRYLSNEIPATL